MRVPGTPPDVVTPPPPDRPPETAAPGNASHAQWYYAQLHHRRIVNFLCGGVIAVAMTGVLPIVFLLGQKRDAAMPFEFQRWAYGLILLGILQLAYAIYLAQIPDWSSVWVVSLATLLLATAYATLMGIRLLASDDNAIIGFFDLHDNPFTSGQEAGWCFLMLLQTGLLSFLAGRFGTRWYLEQKTVSFDAKVN